MRNLFFSTRMPTVSTLPCQSTLKPLQFNQLELAWGSWPCLGWHTRRSEHHPLLWRSLSYHFPKPGEGDGEFHGLRCSRKDKLYCTRHLKGSEGKKYSSWSFWAAEVTCLAMPAARYWVRRRLWMPWRPRSSISGELPLQWALESHTEPVAEARSAAAAAPGCPFDVVSLFLSTGYLYFHRRTLDTLGHN